jgi:hypothetical protein
MGVEKIMTDIVHQLSLSHLQMARILDAKRQVTVRMAELVTGIPDAHPGFGGLEGLIQSSGELTKSVIAYVNSLADLEEAVADSLTNVVKAAQGGADEE